MQTCTCTHIHRYSEKSDVWAFGVTAWEILTEGAIPYFNMSQDDRVISYVCGGGRLTREELAIACSDTLWDIISSCWADAAADRPPFSRLVLLLAKAMGDGIPEAPLQGKSMHIRVSARVRHVTCWTKSVHVLDTDTVEVMLKKIKVCHEWQS